MNKSNIAINGAGLSMLTIDDLARLTGWSRSWIYQLTSANKIPYYKPNGKTIFFREDEVTSFLLQNRQPTIEEMENDATNYLTKNGMI